MLVEQTEANRNIRTAGFEVLLKLGELDQIVFFSYYDKDMIRGSPRARWADALTIKDLATLTAEPEVSSSADLLNVWSENWPGLGTNDVSADRISTAIDQLRNDMLAILAELE